jgi:hypothetical protein
VVASMAEGERERESENLRFGGNERKNKKARWVKKKLAPRVISQRSQTWIETLHAATV